jgi:hypothetical protein
MLAAEASKRSGGALILLHTSGLRDSIKQKLNASEATPFKFREICILTLKTLDVSGQNGYCLSYANVVWRLTCGFIKNPFTKRRSTEVSRYPKTFSTGCVPNNL